ncbi:response regulator [Marinobacter persicus]|uniref:HDOD domain-containing protein n=1 Tax=Marinobacter persicus TaxID=930118 RepID=A0A2S6G8Z1_9GAMM|nr:response regulator [Marinobacter persicus]PPK52575.1 HDOD domain-containing protein [Marinobacter persicus]PPK55548.1 HDOD domain-containing protein [Marinobacter persicus]PPK58462.1 HDOD domain-containing protein [Marinobacter persicus]
MNVLVLEDDELVAELLETVIASAYPGALVKKFLLLEEAIAETGRQHLDLVITDWNLPDGSGLELVRHLRERDSELPIVMVSGRSDRDSVLKAAHYGINGYITKPFSVEMVHERLAALIEPGPVSAEDLDLQAMLTESLEHVIQLPGEQDPAEILALIERANELSPAQLSERWREQPALVTRLLDVANGSSFRRTGKPVETLKDAINLMGVSMALNQALALSLDVGRQLKSPELVELAAKYQEQALKVGREAQRIAISMKKPPVMFQKAGLLSRVGELAVISVINQYIAKGGQLEEGLADQCLRDWAQPYGNRLKVQWRLSLDLRELIGSVHFLQKDAVRNDRLIMRAAALIAEGRQEEEACQILLDRLGVHVATKAEE